MANVLFTRKNASEIPNVPITDGQLIFDTSGNGKMYLDVGDERLEMGGALTVDATLSKTSTNPVQNRAVAGVMLDTLSDISNVTSKGFLADALAVKELNSSLVDVNTSLNNLIELKLEWINDIALAVPKDYGVGFYVLPYDSSGLPSSAWYFVIAFRAQGHITLLAIGMTAKSIYVKFFNSETWQKII